MAIGFPALSKAGDVTRKPAAGQRLAKPRTPSPRVGGEGVVRGRFRWARTTALRLRRSDSRRGPLTLAALARPPRISLRSIRATELFIQLTGVGGDPLDGLVLAGKAVDPAFVALV